MRQDRGHASAHVVATDDGCVPDLNASDIGDRIERPSRKDADLQPQVRGSGRAVEDVLCATAAAVTSKTAMATRVRFMAEPNYMLGSRLSFDSCDTVACSRVCPAVSTHTLDGAFGAARL
jgi:hypothetical protein